MSLDKKESQPPEHEDDDISSSLDYLDPDSRQHDNDDQKEQDKQSQARRKRQPEFQSYVEGTYLYKPGVQLPNLLHLTNQPIKVIISAEYLNEKNSQIRKRNIYGTDTYTSKSDCVCIGIHAGFINLTTFQFKRHEGIEIYLKVVKPKKNYVGSLKNGLLSRSTKNATDNALKPDTYKMLNSLPKLEKLQRYAANMYIPIGKKRTRNPSINLQKLTPLSEAHLVYNMNEEPAHKYTIFNIADKGYDKSEFMIKKLDNFVLYLETSKGEKYELNKGIEGEYFQVYRLSEVKEPKKFDNNYFYENKAPLPEEELNTIEENLEWDEIVWKNTSVRAKDTEIENLISFKYYQKSK